MKAIVDSGSTKSKWVLFDSKSQNTVITSGINPYYQTSEEIQFQLRKELISALNNIPSLDSISYYGAGCEEAESKKIIKEGFEKIFPTTQILVEHDLLAAARSLFGNEKGIACIAGTGSNSCYYDGEKIVKNIYSPGLSLGDEGSGGYLGKLLVRDYIRKRLPANIHKLFEEYTTDRTPDIMHKVYKEPFPNRYLASFAPFVIKNQHDSYLHDLAYKNFLEFFENCIMQYEHYQELPIRFIGSIAYNMSSILMEVAKVKNVTIDKIEKDPMDGLLKFHSKEEVD